MGERYVEARQLRKYAPPYAEMIMGAMNGHKAAGNSAAWCQKQTYIALSFALAAAAEHRIATCPMEGFSPADVGKIVGVADDEEVCCILAVGRYPADEKAYTGGYDQFRFPKEEIFKTV